jgi:hypothetical protein
MQGSGNVIGVTSTPVISVADNKIYVVSKSPGMHQLHAIDLATGAETAGSPVTIGAGMADFNPNIHLNRPGLLLLNGVVYIAPFRPTARCPERASYGPPSSTAATLGTTWRTAPCMPSTPPTSRTCRSCRGTRDPSATPDSFVTAGNAKAPAGGCACRCL